MKAHALQLPHVASHSNLDHWENAGDDFRVGGGLEDLRQDRWALRGSFEEKASAEIWWLVEVEEVAAFMDEANGMRVGSDGVGGRAAKNESQTSHKSMVLLQEERVVLSLLVVEDR
mmetsp:Transcript_34057/g.84904  ORF Transcript_34057/g.84904 Transcript_34057/m.84904 type:complete len:116 (-) Transcript_34057:119-466(-)